MSQQYVRTSIEEEEYLNRQKLSFSEWTHRDFRQDIEQEKKDVKQKRNNIRKTKFQNFTLNFILAAIGITFLLFSPTQNIYYASILIGGIGGAFVVYGVSMFILELITFGR